MASFGIFLTRYKDNKTIQLPVNPSELKLKYEGDNKSQTIVNLGEINQLGNLKLVDITIESVFPKAKTTYLALKAKKRKKPDTYIKWIKKVQKDKDHLRFVVTNTKISMVMNITSFEYGFKDGNEDEYVYTLEPKQYRKYSAKKIKKKKKTKSKKGKSRVSPPKKFSVGSSVIVNGRLHLTSNGGGSGAYEKHAKRKVINIASGHTYPVCVGLNGIARGWVKKSEVKKA